jgi:hypothetical protein
MVHTCNQHLGGRGRIVSLRPVSKERKKEFGAGGVVEHLPNKCKTEFKPQYCQKKEKKKFECT